MLKDSKRLYDIATRQQVYLEGVKAGMTKDFGFVLAELRTELTKLLGRIKYKTLDGMTKGELTNLMLALRKSQSKVYSAYTKQLLEQLKEFTSTNLEVASRLYVKAKIETDSDAENEPLSYVRARNYIERQRGESIVLPVFGWLAALQPDKAWTVVTNAPLPANGLFLLPFIKTFAVSAQAGVENAIRKAYANGTSVADLVRELTGENSAQGVSSQLQRIGVQASAVIATSAQHAFAITNAAVMSAMFEYYGWYSVMDGKTTEICRSRNLKVYKFGKGPLPPGHVRCRSHIAPIVENNDISAETFYTWLARQPEDVQADIVGNDAAKKQKSDAKFETKVSLTLDEYKEKVLKILSR